MQGSQGCRRAAAPRTTVQRVLLRGGSLAGWHGGGRTVLRCWRPPHALRCWAAGLLSSQLSRQLKSRPAQPAAQEQGSSAEGSRESSSPAAAPRCLPEGPSDASSLLPPGTDPSSASGGEGASACASAPAPCLASSPAAAASQGWLCPRAAPSEPLLQAGSVKTSSWRPSAATRGTRATRASFAASSAGSASRKLLVACATGARKGKQVSPRQVATARSQRRAWRRDARLGRRQLGTTARAQQEGAALRDLGSVAHAQLHSPAHAPGQVRAGPSLLASTSAGSRSHTPQAAAPSTRGAAGRPHHKR